MRKVKTVSPQDTVDTLLASVQATITEHQLANVDTAVLLMVSGGSDSTALAYLAADLRAAGNIGALAMLHVNHQLRGDESDADMRFVQELAQALDIPLFVCEVDVAAEAARTRENVEAVARRERYTAANEALVSMCEHEGYSLNHARIFTAHTADDRAENFYMRSIVGTGPGGFRSMRYLNGNVAHPLLNMSRDELRTYIEARATIWGRGYLVETGENQPTNPVPNWSELWREDATNAHTDRFRAYVRHVIVPKAKEWNPSLLPVLTRTMNLIADEDDMLESFVTSIIDEQVEPLSPDHLGTGLVGCSTSASIFSKGFRLTPRFGSNPLPLQRRAVYRLLTSMLSLGERVESASVQAVLDGFEAGGLDDAVATSSDKARAASPKSGYVTNIQGNLAVSANKLGVRVEPMAAFRARRKRG